jgi:multicomponent Na+:H+ antiporter subunit D
MGTMDTQQWIILVILLISSLLNIAYLLPISMRAFLFKDPTSNAAVGIKEAPLPCLIAIGITTVGCIALFIYPQPLYELASSILQTSRIAHGQ